LQERYLKVKYPYYPVKLIRKQNPQTESFDHIRYTECFTIKMYKLHVIIVIHVRLVSAIFMQQK